MFSTVLIANRGEIACRVITTLRRMGIRSVAVYSEADAGARHVAMADRAVRIGPAAASASYLNVEAILAACAETGAQAVHPGYGFLSENAAFAEACEARGIAFIGPTPDQIRRFGLKHEARAIAEAAGVPLLPGTGLLTGVEEALREAERIGYPVMLKSTAGGGGIGLSVCLDAAALREAYNKVIGLGARFFSDGGVFLEKYVARARHLEVQLFGDGKGGVVALGERECSVQRRNQKVLEESPAPRLPDAARTGLHESAVALGKAISYRSAGTVEFVLDDGTGAFYFLEVNTRLQVEHPVTEAVGGVDLVEWMVRQAAGEGPDLAAHRHVPRGSAIEVRVYAEDPLRDYAPSSGTLTEVALPEDARCDGWVEAGTEVTSYYDPLLLKLIVHGADRAEAVAKLNDALARTRLGGIQTNLGLLREVAADPRFAAGETTTKFLDGVTYRPNAVEVVEPGTYSTVQDFPGRIGLWRIGVPPSGPMDHLAFRLANRVVGNPEGAAALELTVVGPTLRFHAATTIALCGAAMPATLDGAEVPFWQPVTVPAGATLALGAATGAGARTYLAVRGGLDVPEYLGSKATFALGNFGGHAGRPLRPGDVLPLNEAAEGLDPPRPVPDTLIPQYVSEWEVGVLYGPHGAPDFFTDEAIDAFFAAAWEVHYNSNRLGVRLLGPKPTWARRDGGEAGLHPSNIHDCEYAVGSVNFTGDMPVVLTCDGPSLGGFVCPVTIAQAELWKLGQAKPGDKIRFRRITFADALAREEAQNAALTTLSASAPPLALPTRFSAAEGGPILHAISERPGQVAVAYRQAGDKYVLIEYGPNVLDLRSRFRVHALTECLNANPVPGIIELSPGVRSLQVNYDSRMISQDALMQALLAAERALPATDAMRVTTRVLHMPMAFEDADTIAAVAKYRQSVRDTAPWLPSNTEFMRRINGLGSVEDVRRILYEASYMVLGLGDVYLGAPCAVPVDPRHRLLTSKYNPARTFTPEGTVGIGGVYMCIYGMDSPGGYQLVGRTVPIWNRYTRNSDFTPGEPWLLRFFDQVRFYPVEEAELTELRIRFRDGRFRLRVEEEVFDLGAHEAFLRDNAADIATFKARQQAAFDTEVARWQAEPEWVAPARPEAEAGEEAPLTAGQHAVRAETAGNVWKLLVSEGDSVEAGQPVAVIEAMKMELRVPAPAAGRVGRLACAEGMLVRPGQRLMVLEAA